MDHPEGASETGDEYHGSDRRVRLEFRETQLSSDGGSIRRQSGILAHLNGAQGAKQSIR
jgi:hypothetical protein